MLYDAGLPGSHFFVLIMAICVILLVGVIERKYDIREKIFEQNIVVRWTIIYVLIFSILIFGCYGVGYNPTAFIYQQF